MSFSDLKCWRLPPFGIVFRVARLSLFYRDGGFLVVYNHAVLYITFPLIFLSFNGIFVSCHRCFRTNQSLYRNHGITGFLPDLPFPSSRVNWHFYWVVGWIFFELDFYEVVVIEWVCHGSEYTRCILLIFYSVFLKDLLKIESGKNGHRQSKDKINVQENPLREGGRGWNFVIVLSSCTACIEENQKTIHWSRR